MTRAARTLAWLVIACAPGITQAAAQAAEPAAGHWEGKIRVGTRPDVPVAIDIWRNGNDIWVGSFSALDATARDMPLSALAVEQLTVRFSLALPRNPLFDGKIAEDGRTMTGTATSTAGSDTFELVRTGDPKVANPAQSYLSPFTPPGDRTSLLPAAMRSWSLVLLGILFGVLFFHSVMFEVVDRGEVRVMPGL